MTDRRDYGRGSRFARLLPQVARACQAVGLTLTVRPAQGKRDEAWTFSCRVTGRAVATYCPETMRLRVGGELRRICTDWREAVAEAARLKG
jgi:hypothetical protein